jgi:hypothetical protein
MDRAKGQDKMTPKLKPNTPVMVFNKYPAIVHSVTREREQVPGYVVLDRKVLGYWSHATADVAPIQSPAARAMVLARAKKPKID